MRMNLSIYSSPPQEKRNAPEELDLMSIYRNKWVLIARPEKILDRIGTNVVVPCATPERENARLPSSHWSHSNKNGNCNSNKFLHMARGMTPHQLPLWWASFHSPARTFSSLRKSSTARAIYTQTLKMAPARIPFVEWGIPYMFRGSFQQEQVRKWPPARSD